MQRRYLLPPRVETSQGEVRAAGFEFEFGNLPIARTASALQGALGGKLQNVSPFEALLHGTRLGQLKVERDADLLKSTRYRKWLEQFGLEFSPGSLGHEIETSIDSASRTLIPCEVVTAPIPLTGLAVLDELVGALESIGAEGTQQSLIYAFGLHINAALPDTDCATILRCLQAFLLLHLWLVETGDTDKTRRFLTRYIDPFPQDYMERVLDVDYAPDLAGLMDDYLHHNPTRNRALDLLPIFDFLDPDRVSARLPRDERRLVKGRPAFHFRLPDCRVNASGWSVAAAWNHWVYVEKLAAEGALLEELIGAWRRHYDEFMLAQDSRWVQRLTSLLAEKFLAGDANT